jgi:hypothetical protein
MLPLQGSIPETDDLKVMAQGWQDQKRKTDTSGQIALYSAISRVGRVILGFLNGKVLNR